VAPSGGVGGEGGKGPGAAVAVQMVGMGGGGRPATEKKYNLTVSLFFRTYE